MMSATTTKPGTSTVSAGCDAATRVTRSLLGYGVIAGPFYLIAGLIEALTRSGFDSTRDDLSLLSNGGLGWIHITILVTTGLMTIAAAAGMRRALGPGQGGTWGPRLLGAYGAALIAAGALVADPMNGFPAGTPAGPPAHLSWHGAGHLAAAAAGFLCLTGACLVLARWFTQCGERRWAAYSRISGLVFFAGFAAVATGSGSRPTVLALWIGVAAGWAWVSAVSAYLYRRAPELAQRMHATATL
jgi:hypothetical protein